MGILSAVDSDTNDTHTFTLAISGDSRDDDNASFTSSAEPVFLLTPPQIMKQNPATILTSMPVMEPNNYRQRQLMLPSQMLTKHPVILA